MFAYAALLLAGFSATNVAAVQPSDLAFGREQVEQFIHDRPDAGEVINRNPALKEQLALLFADDGLGVNGQVNHVHWDSEEPTSPFSECYPVWNGKRSSVRVTSRSSVTPIDKCSCLTFELHNVRDGHVFNAFWLMATQKQMSREDYVRSVVRREFETRKKTRQFFHEHPLDDPNTKDNPGYASFMRTPGDFGDYYRRLENSCAGADYLNRYRKDYDDVVAPESDCTKIATSERYAEILTLGDQPSIFMRHLDPDLFEKAEEGASNSVPTQITHAYVWGDARDWTFAVSYFALIALVLAVGYGSMGLHIRDYLRSLRRALVLIGHYSRELPEWIRRDRPRCIQALGLHLPCTTAQVLSAYRKKVKLSHPDLGGDPREFLRLQDYFEQAMALVRD